MHAPTLLIVTSVLLAMMCVVMAVVWHFNRRIPGLKGWALSYGVAFVVSALLLNRRDIAHPLAVGVTMAGIFIGPYLNLAAARAHVGLPRLPLFYPALGTVAMVSTAVYLTAYQPMFGLRVALASTVAGVLYLLGAAAFVRGGLAQYPARRIMATACGLHGGFLLLRPWLFHVGASLQDVDLAARLSHYVVLESIVALVLLAFCVAMLVNEHITSELRQLAERDPLTGVYNRRAFMDLLDKAASLARRSQTALPLLVLDLDHFKQVNDRFGHSTGDALLRHFVQVAEPCLRKEDVLGRLGGEEFAIFMPLTPPADVARIGERLRAAVAAQPLLSDHGPISLTVSIGSTVCGPGDSPDLALNRADQAMYRAKEAGRNRIVSLATT